MSHRICDLEGCELRHHSKGYCRPHYRRWNETGSPYLQVRTRKLDGESRACSTCKTEKDTSEFAKSQYICRTCRKKYNANNYRSGRTCVVCSTAIADKNKYDWCLNCYRANRRGIPRKSGRFLNAQGYMVLSGNWEHPNAWKGNGCILEHVKVMSEILGRPLQKGENVHHLNGVRDDNRPENLELWVSSQPWGQRVPDLLAWAHEIIDTYQDEHSRLSQPN